MVALEWNETYSVGVPMLDDDHKKLISIINRVEEAERNMSAVQWALDQLSEYARYHFAREEEMLEAANYADLAEHRRQHGAFIEWLGSVKKTYSLSPEAHGYISETVRDYLRSWLVNHILATDMEYKDVLS